MTKKQSKDFFSDRSSLDMDQYLVFDYVFESFIDPEEAAAHLCQEQSTAQWKRVGVDEDLREQFGAKVIELSVEKTLDHPSLKLPSVSDTRSYVCRVKIAHPHGNFGPKLPNLLTAACGEGAFFSPGISLIKLIDIEFPSKFLEHFEGPKFGVEGLRDILGIYDRPIFFGVVKPNIGLPPEPFAELARQSWLGGLDIAKDDELLGDVPWSPLSKRTALVGKVRKECEKATGMAKIYLVNITDEVDRLIELHDIVVRNGANAVMLNTMTVGLSAARMLQKHTKVPLVAHFDFIAAFTRIPNYGVSSELFTKLQRLAGFDSIILPGFGSRMKTSDSEVFNNVEECLKPMGHIKPSLPVPAGSQWAASTGELHQKLNTIDFGIVPGRGVFGHPMGPRAGAASLLQGWEAYHRGIPLEDYAKSHVELRASMEAFGN
ncbi:MAG: ribulose 1,5-bisphosphate carboxylase [Deltaproteobacteria bacterium]|nr:ribulose 1,5-bisphosphate carboxylase [Deltaproteobacteria bacterium]MBW1934430.1 ribulose 1,5-bisphosphate carboxylase [Deltaproteobacteria bacterium]MBW1976893.1 ribulose 1,5-bisphosphate carboxylase [Deltaproteobacteria bacterium]MBW2043548.1 ribulose 1,5-bisphosphate carboxylase [Deltaproteobacteria bacterium]MBW2299635.1 ribulose 1,5-bisphosphate carboxylase [Deltaproteobacteria bacterium]